MDKSQYKGIFVFAEQRHGKIQNVAYELLGKARDLADHTNQKVYALLFGNKIAAQAKDLIAAGADDVIVVEDPALEIYTTEPYAQAMAHLIAKYKPEVVLIGATTIGRDLGPRLSARIVTGLTADCTKLEISEAGDLLMTRPAFGGNLMATIICTEHRPQMATVRSGVMQREVLDENYKGEVVYPDVAKYVPQVDYVVKVIDRHVEEAKHNLKGAPIVVAGGYGVGSKEGFDQLFLLAKELHGEVGASRAAVDAGFVEHDRQIGQTGVTVHPKVYIACGISGQIQHIAGMQDSGIIISINNDPDAPINQIADYVIVGSVEEVVPKLIKYYKKNSK